MGVLLGASPARAHPPGEARGEGPLDEAAASGEAAAEEELEVTVRGEAPGGDAASRVRFGRRELELRPRLRPGDIVEAVPGVFAVQHAGGGKSNQYFLRGFDADHGTDVRITVDGIPANMVSHGHGQGYADLHFLIPELVVELEGYKGAHYAHLGDFATAGAIEMELAEVFDESFAQLQVGQYGIVRGLVVASPELLEGWRSVLAGEVFADDGPFENEEDLQRFNLYAKVTRDVGERSKVSLSWMSYGSGWNGSGQLPARAVCGEGEESAPRPEDFGERCIDRFGFVDPSEGGSTQRHAARVAVETGWDDTDLIASAHVMRQNFTLFSNFTFFAEDPVRGDGIEQTDARTMTGTDLRLRRHLHLGRSVFTTSVGLQMRYDAIDNTLHHMIARERLEPRVDASIGETGIGLYVEEDARLTRWLRMVIGLRVDRFDVRVDDNLENAGDIGTRSSGVAGDTAVSPKGSVVVTPVHGWEVFSAAGRGFHSNDARGAVLDTNPTDLLTVARTYEVGTRIEPLAGLTFDAAGFLIDLDSEIVWVGDAGGTEASGATRRFGLEVTGRYKLENWLFADAALTFVNPRYRSNAGNGQAVALAPTRTFTLGGGVRPRVGDFVPAFGFRVKSIADRPATEDASLIAEGFTTVDVNTSLRWRNIELGLDIQNLFDASYREVNFATETRLAYEPSAVNGIHYSPGWPFTAIGRAAVYWD
jgi:outer membrane receptor protein involved in Fe transport